MKINNRNYSSSQQSPQKSFSYNRTYKISAYSHMFFEDFTSSYSILFSPTGSKTEFYQMDDTLKDLLRFDNYYDLNDELDCLLSTITYQLLLNGKAYIEVVVIKDSCGVVRGIKLIPINAKQQIKFSGKLFFKSFDYNKKLIRFNVDNDWIIIFDLKDLGFHRNFFLKLVNHLSVFDVTNATDLLLDHELEGKYDFQKHHNYLDYHLIKDTRSIYWLGRNYSNKYLSESYLLYRTLKYKCLRNDFLQYILSKINDRLSLILEESSFSGGITATVNLSLYEDAFCHYLEGKINATQLGDIIIKNKTP